MHSDQVVRRAFRLLDSGASTAQVARTLGVARSTIRDWFATGETALLASPARMRSSAISEPCADGTIRCLLERNLDEEAFAYLLGQYLGDGYISSNGRSFRLRISCCDQYPGIMREVVSAVERVLPGVEARHVARTGCTEVAATSAHWPCLLPHGPGRKHLRSIVLADWQRSIALDRHPAPFVRGLIHSDGCRCTNRVRAGAKTYEYPRYLFSNKSDDIRGLFLEACARLGVEARPNNHWSVSIARRGSVARLDELVGPKR